MRILVVEPNENKHTSVTASLADHDVTVVSSFDEAMDIMRLHPAEKTVRRLLTEAGFPNNPDSDDPELMRAYRKALRDAEAQSAAPFGFDVVLTEMELPMSERMLLPSFFNPDANVPYGFVIALKAAFRGATYVAMVSDTEHTDGAMSAALAHIGGEKYEDGASPNFTINGCKVMFVHMPHATAIMHNVPCNRCFDAPIEVVKFCRNCKGTGRYNRTDVLASKDWGRVLADLTAHSANVPYRQERLKTPTNLTVPPLPAVQSA